MLRMPRDAEELKTVERRWSKLNGRYWITADVILDDGQYCPGVGFDGDSHIAVDAQDAGTIPPDLVGKRIIAYLVLADSTSRHKREATKDDRLTFKTALLAAGHLNSRP